MIRIGIVQTGTPREPLLSRFGSYAAMIERLLGDGHDCHIYDATIGALPDQPEVCDAYIVTGSSADAFSQLPWIVRLKAFLRLAAGRVPLVGICFGHQVMAETFGGRVGRSEHGWGLGLHSYFVRQRQPWMGPEEVISLPVSHRDQILTMPPNASLLASSFFCPVAALHYHDFPALSFQAHPEFDTEFARALIRQNLGQQGSAEHAALALQTLDNPADQAVIGGWIRDFLAHHT